MNINRLDSSQITRKNFLQTCGSIIAGGTIAGISAILISRMLNKKEQMLYTCDKNVINQHDCSCCTKICHLQKPSIINHNQ